MPLLWWALAACVDAPVGPASVPVLEPVGPASATAPEPGAPAPDLLVQVRIDGDTYTRFQSEYAWSTLTVRLQTPEGQITSEATAQPRVELGCGEDERREGALQSVRCWYAGGGYDVDLVRRGDELALVRFPIGMNGRTGPAEDWLVVPLPPDAVIEMQPVWEAPYAWLDIRPEANELVLRLMSGDPPHEIVSARTAAQGPCEVTDRPDDEALEAWQCANGLYVARAKGPSVALVDPHGARGAHLVVPEGVRTGW